MVVLFINRAFIHSLILPFVNSVSRSFVRACLRTFVRSFFTHVVIHSLSFIRFLVHSFSQSVTRSFVRLFIKLINRSLLFSQLFKRPHPPKRVFRSVESDSQTGALVNVDRLFFHNLPNLVPSAQPVKGKSPCVQNF